MDINCITVTGRLTEDPEEIVLTRETMVKFAVAVQRNKELTDFFNCKGFGKTKDLIIGSFKNGYTGKGTRVAITGRMNINRVRKDEVTKLYPELVINSIAFLDSKKSIESKNNGVAKSEIPLANTTGQPEDLRF